MGEVNSVTERNVISAIGWAIDRHSQGKQRAALFYRGAKPRGICTETRALDFTPQDSGKGE